MKRFLPVLALLLAACAPSVASAPPDWVLKVDAPLLMMNATDLPSQGKYTIPDVSWTGEVDNQAVLDAWGAQDGDQYINDTGRLDGWWIEFRRTNDSAVMPREVYDSVAVYRTVAGARLSVQKYADHAMQAYTPVADTPQIGDGARAFILRKNGTVEYDLYFSFRNCQHVLEILGTETEVTPDFALTIAQSILKRLESAPLAAPGS